MSFTLREVVAVFVAFSVVHLLASAYVLWQQSRDLGHLYDEVVTLRENAADDQARLEKLEDRVADVIDWAWESSDQERPEPDDEPKTAPIEVAPPTVPSHPADTFARKASTLDRLRHIGQHRA